MNGMLTYSKAKEITELLGSRALLNGNSHNTKATARRTRPWYIVDVSGYYTVKNTSPSVRACTTSSTTAMLLGKMCGKLPPAQSTNTKMSAFTTDMPPPAATTHLAWK